MMKSLFAASAIIFFLSARPGFAQWSGCPDRESPDGQAVLAVDVSQEVTQEFIDAAKAKNVTTIFRYYDWEALPGEQNIVHLDQDWEQIPSLCGKVPSCGEPASEAQRQLVREALRNRKCNKVISKGELDLIHKNKMSVGIVFQHRMSCVRTWRDTKRASYDADRAIALARSLGQPVNTAIYFGVDGADQNFKDKDELNEGKKLIEAYFATVSAKLRDANYEIGVYGSGLACRRLRDELKYVKYCWLSMSTGHPESKNYEAKQVSANTLWELKQCFEKKSMASTGIGYSPDVLNSSKNEFGFWPPPSP